MVRLWAKLKGWFLRLSTCFLKFFIVNQVLSLSAPCQQKFSVLLIPPPTWAKFTATNPKFVLIHICLDLIGLNNISSPIIASLTHFVNVISVIGMYDHLLQCKFNLDHWGGGHLVHFKNDMRHKIWRVK